MVASTFFNVVYRGDEPKRESNIRKHRMDFADAHDRFEWADAVVEAAKPGPDGRPRFLAVGFLDGQRGHLGHQPTAGEPQREESL